MWTKNGVGGGKFGALAMEVGYVWINGQTVSLKFCSAKGSLLGNNVKLNY